MVADYSQEGSYREDERLKYISNRNFTSLFLPLDAYTLNDNTQLYYNADFEGQVLHNPNKYIEGGMLKLTKGIGLDSAVNLSRQDEATSAFLHTPQTKPNQVNSNRMLYLHCNVEKRQREKDKTVETYTPRRTGETLATGQEGLRQGQRLRGVQSPNIPASSGGIL